MEHFDGMTAFVKIAELKSLSAAALALNTTPSALSKSLKRLEERLHVSLLHRTTRRVALTDAGAEFLDHCKVVLTHVGAAEAAMLNHSTKGEKSLRVHLPVVFAESTVVPNLPRFYEAFPDMRLDLVLTDRPIDMIGEGCALSVCMGALPDTGARHRILARTYRITCGSPEYLQLHGVPKRVADLAQHQCIATTAWDYRLNWLFKSQVEFDRLHLSPFLQVSTGNALREAALNGLGIIQSSSYHLAADLQAGRLLPVLENEIVEGDTIGVIYPHRQFPSPSVTGFVEFLIEAVATKTKLTHV